MPFGQVFQPDGLHHTVRSMHLETSREHDQQLVGVNACVIESMLVESNG